MDDNKPALENSNSFEAVVNFLDKTKQLWELLAEYSLTLPVDSKNSPYELSKLLEINSKFPGIRLLYDPLNDNFYTTTTINGSNGSVIRIDVSLE